MMVAWPSADQLSNILISEAETLRFKVRKSLSYTDKAIAIGIAEAFEHVAAEFTAMQAKALRSQNEAIEAERKMWNEISCGDGYGSGDD